MCIYIYIQSQHAYVPAMLAHKQNIKNFLPAMLACTWVHQNILYCNYMCIYTYIYTVTTCLCSSNAGTQAKHQRSLASNAGMHMGSSEYSIC